jgi:hypothetical protein
MIKLLFKKDLNPKPLAGDETELNFDRWPTFLGFQNSRLRVTAKVANVGFRDLPNKNRAKLIHKSSWNA